jgi:short-subunit dehydrogenase
VSRAHAIVIGASSGLGLAVARRLKRSGHVVSGLSRRAAPGEAVDSAHACDVTDSASLESAVSAAIGAHGPPDVMVYAAGVPAMGKTLDVPREAARRAFEVNFWGLDNAVRAVLPIMGARRRGTIVGLSSIVALRPVPYEAFYAASKAAAARYLGCLAHEASRSGVRVKYLNIGYVDTGFAQSVDWFGMETPAGGAGSGVGPDDVAEATMRLLEGERISTTLGWKENAIALADRMFPELYDRLLRLRR